jgi:serine/threonine protein kinase
MTPTLGSVLEATDKRYNARIMSLSPGTQLGPYEIQALVGAGGMGEVYRARDTRLDRTIAIKVLPARLSSDPDLKQRLDREARAISSLNDPHICALYDIGMQEGIAFLVMEFLEGETLADRLQKGALPIERVLDIGIEIASALMKAHRKGIVHRDLKPSNIMLTKSGARLMDFGIARPAQVALVSGTGVSDRTVSKSLTEKGAILGTFQYMAPEQLEGKDADMRSDIFAFGAVLYEMATGKRAFDGKSPISVLAAILEREPEPVAKLKPMAPPALEHVVKRCLAKDPEDRFQTAQDVMIELKWVREGKMLVPTKGSSKLRWIGATGLISLIAVTVGLTPWFTARHQPPTKVVASIPAPEDAFFYSTLIPVVPAVSPNGRYVTFLAAVKAKVQLWVHSLDSGTSRPIPGTEDATFPFWSPDSNWIGFFARGKLMKVDLRSDPPIEICDAPQGRGGNLEPKRFHSLRARYTVRALCSTSFWRFAIADSAGRQPQAYVAALALFSPGRKTLSLPRPQPQLTEERE